ncbi:MAG TPA: toprim domain-containing protein [Roseiarcus sp.]|nr:toprim domain-containing protein [Roseiarcus sp.]
MMKTADFCKDRWPQVLAEVGCGLSEAALKHKNTSCPVCGGTDRFQFSDKGEGVWFCRGCGRGGGGVQLVMHMKRLGFKEAVALIDSALGRVSTTPAKPNGDSAPKPLDPMKPWRNALPDIADTQVIPYLGARGIVPTALEAASLRAHPQLFHWPSQQTFPAMVARVTLWDGTELTSHSTFLKPDGSAKAEIEKPRLFSKCDSIKGGGVWFGVARPEDWLLVCEGIETWMSAARLYRVEVGAAALSASGLRLLVLPPLPLAKRIRIFADHDPDGLAAAVVARARWTAEGRQVVISHASEPGLDANDVWLRRLQKAQAA